MVGSRDWGGQHVLQVTRRGAVRKVIIAPVKSATPTESWLNLEELATVEVTSEEAGCPIESVFLSDGKGWRAAYKGAQTVRLTFDGPTRLSRIWLVFEDTETERTQEFVLRWSPDKGQTFHEIVRQQWNFSPPESAREIENYKVELLDVTILELVIVPDNRNGEAKASLAKFLLA
jgi:hypothetical protein